MIYLDDGTGFAQALVLGEFLQRQDRSARDVQRIADFHNLELGLGLGPLFDGIEYPAEFVEAGMGGRVVRVFLPFRLTDDVADPLPDSRLGDEVDIGVRVCFPAFALENASRLPKLNEIFDAIEAWTMTKTKFEVMEICNPRDIPVGPILSMKELSEEPSLRETGTIVEVDHPERGPYLTVGCPIKLTDSPVEVERSPLLGEHTDEVLRDVLGYSDEEVAARVAETESGEVEDISRDELFRRLKKR